MLTLGNSAERIFGKLTRPGPRCWALPTARRHEFPEHATNVIDIGVSASGATRSRVARGAKTEPSFRVPAPLHASLRIPPVQRGGNHLPPGHPPIIGYQTPYLALGCCKAATARPLAARGRER
jgi:hypothetical protein